jgi:hypothetical protein
MSSAAAAVASRMFSPQAAFKAATTNLFGTVQKAAAQATGSEKVINWTAYNWPLPYDFGALLHFDLVELREKRPEGVFHMINAFYSWHRATLLLLAVNFVTTIILVAAAQGSDPAQPAYSGIAILAACAWGIVIPAANMSVVYKAYHGWAEGSRVSQLMARGLMLLTIILAMIQAFGGFGNINGWARFNGASSGSFREADAKRVPAPVISFWQAMTVLESGSWLAQLGVQGWMAYRMMAGPVAPGLAAQAQPTGGATAPKS